MDLYLTISMCRVVLSAVKGAVVDLVPLGGCPRPQTVFQGHSLWASSGSGASVPLSGGSTFIRKVVVSASGTVVTLAVSLEQKSWF